MKVGYINSYARLIHGSFDEIDNLLYDEDYAELPNRFSRDSFKNLRQQFRSEIIYNLSESDFTTVEDSLKFKFNGLICDFENKYQTTVFDCNFHKNEELILSLYSCLKEEIQYIKWLFDENSVNYGLCVSSGLYDLYQKGKYSADLNEVAVWEDSSEINVGSYMLNQENEIKDDCNNELTPNIENEFRKLFKSEWQPYINLLIQELEIEGIIKDGVFSRNDKNYLAKIIAFLMEEGIVYRSKIEPLVRIVYSRFGRCVYGDKEMKPENNRCVTMKNLTKAVNIGVTPDEEYLFRGMLKQIKK